MKNFAIILVLTGACTFAAAASPTPPSAASPSAAATDMQRAKMALGTMDADKDSRVSLKEFLSMPTKNFEEIDANKDGFITAEELRDWQARQAKLREQAQKAYKDAMAAAQKDAPTPAGKTAPGTK